MPKNIFNQTSNSSQREKQDFSQEDIQASEEYYLLAQTEEDKEKKNQLLECALSCNPNNYKAAYQLIKQIKDPFRILSSIDPLLLFATEQFISELHAHYTTEEEFPESEPFIRLHLLKATSLIQVNYYYEAIAVLQQLLLFENLDTFHAKFLLASCYVFTEQFDQLQQFTNSSTDSPISLLLPKLYMNFLLQQHDEFEKTLHLIEEKDTPLISFLQIIMDTDIIDPIKFTHLYSKKISTQEANELFSILELFPYVFNREFTEKIIQNKRKPNQLT